MKCERCGKEVEVVVSFSTPGGPKTPQICLKCLRRVRLDIVASAKRMAATGKAQAAREARERKAHAEVEDA